jgi:hypothetical protein
MAEREINGLSLGVYAVAVHDAPNVDVVDLDVGAEATHTPTIHVRCTFCVRRLESLQTLRHQP